MFNVSKGYKTTSNSDDLQVVHIGMETSTFDRVEKDIKNSLETQIGLLGGTFGLFTGFSILSGVEILYFVSKNIAKIFYKKLFEKKKRPITDV